MLVQKQIHVLLVSPKTPHSYWGGQLATWFVGKKAMHIPLPLITLAALLPTHWSVTLVDLNIETLSDAEILKADAVLLTGMIIQRDSMAEIIQRCRSLNRHIIVGGPFVSSSPDAIELREATSLVIGEAESESLIAHIASDIERGSIQSRYLEGGKPHMAQSPIPRFDLLKWKAYGVMSIQTSRGCPHHCEFCNVRMLNGVTPRYKSASQVVAELQAIADTGYRGNVFVVDDNFIGNKNVAKQILHAIIQWQRDHGKPFRFYTEADMRLSEYMDVVDLMVEAGFFAVFQGLETPSAEALKETGKTQNLRVDAALSARLLRQRGLLVYGGFIVGFDTDDPSIFERVRQMINACCIEIAMVGMLFAIPGTPLEHRLKREGRLLEQRGKDGFEETNIQPMLMSRLELLQGYRKLLESLYTPRQYFKRAYVALSEWKQSSPGHVSFREFLAVPISIFLQGIVSKYRHHYWIFMLRTLFQHPNKLARAFTTAICGHHFFRYTERVVIPRLREAEARLLLEEAA